MISLTVKNYDDFKDVVDELGRGAKVSILFIDRTSATPPDGFTVIGLVAGSVMVAHKCSAKPSTFESDYRKRAEVNSATGAAG